MLPLELSIAPGNWNIFNGRKYDKAFHSLRDKVFARDYYTCQYCGFQAREHQEVVNIDGDYRNNPIDNLATACVFCSQCLFLESVGVAFGGGKLIFLPEITQAELNSFCHVIFCAMTNKTAYINSAQVCYRNLRLYAQPVEKKFGNNTSSPANFSRLLLNQREFNSSIQKELFKEIRLLPSYTKFKAELSDWAAAAVAELSKEGEANG